MTGLWSGPGQEPMRRSSGQTTRDQHHSIGGYEVVQPVMAALNIGLLNALNKRQPLTQS